MRTIRYFSSILVVTVLMLGCSNNQRSPNEPIPRKTFVQLYTELLLAGESGLLSTTDTATTVHRSSTLDSLFAKYGVTEEQVRETLREYNKDLRTWKEFYDEVTKRLETMQKEEQSKKQL